MIDVTGIHKLSPRKIRRAAKGQPEKQPRIAPSLLSADFTNIASELKRFNDSGAEILHLDIMDGHFVPNLTFGWSLVKAMRPLAPDAVFDVHLMMTDPFEWIDRFCDAGANMLTVHAECSSDVSVCIDAINARGVTAGVSVKPGTPASAVFPYLDKVGLVLVMTVEPGFGGQGMIEECLEKIAEIKAEAKRLGNEKLLVSIDGGVNADNCAMAAGKGADILVAGNAVFGEKDMKAAYAQLTKLIRSR